MRLIRCTTENSESRFSGRLNDDINLEPGSSIALQSLSCSIEPTSLDLRNQEDRSLTWTIEGTTVSTLDVAIPSDIYQVNNAQTLIESTAAALNRSLYYNIAGAAAFTRASSGGFEHKILGSEWNVQVTDRRKTLITLRKGDIGTHEAEFMRVNENRTDYIQAANLVTVQGNTVREFSVTPGAPPPGEETQVMMCGDPIASGTGFIECVPTVGVHDAALDPDRNGFMLGLSYTDLSNVDPDELRDNIDNYMDYGVGMAFEAGTDNVRLMSQYINSAGASVGPGEVNQGNLGKALVAGDQNNPRVRLQISDGIIWFMTTDGPSTAVGNLKQSTILSLPRPNVQPAGNRPLWPFVVFYSDQTKTAIAELNVALTPDGNTSQVVPPAGSSPTYWPLTPLFTPFTSTLSFPSEQFASYLGFTNERLPVSGTQNAVQFFAESTYRFAPTVRTTDVIVLCESFELDSFDTSQQQRKSILAVIPVTGEIADSGVIYERRDLNFINIKNTKAQTFRNLRFRLVDASYQPLRINGQASLVVLTKTGEGN